MHFQKNGAISVTIKFTKSCEQVFTMKAWALNYTKIYNVVLNFG